MQWLLFIANAVHCQELQCIDYKPVKKSDFDKQAAELVFEAYPECSLVWVYLQRAGNFHYRMQFKVDIWVSTFWTCMQSWLLSGSLSCITTSSDRCLRFQSYANTACPPKYWKRRPSSSKTDVDTNFRKTLLHSSTAWLQLHPHSCSRSSWRSLMEMAMTRTSPEWWWLEVVVIKRNSFFVVM